MNAKTTVIKNEKCWMEHTALTQLENVASLPGVIRAVGLPDLHAGKSPIGIAVETKDVFYPHLIGNDIGCGMGLFATNALGWTSPSWRAPSSGSAKAPTAGDTSERTGLWM